MTDPAFDDRPEYRLSHSACGFELVLGCRLCGAEAFVDIPPTDMFEQLKAHSLQGVLEANAERLAKAYHSKCAGCRGAPVFAIDAYRALGVPSGSEAR